MATIDYSKLSEITVTNQAELDAIPDDFKGRIYIKCNATVSVSKRYYWSVVARGNSSVVAWDNSSVVAWDNSSVVARGNSSVEARGNSSVVARGNSSVEARGNSSVEAGGNTQVVNRQFNGKVKLSGNARQVFMPKNIHEFMDFYGIKHTKKTATFYKAVHKDGNGYFSDHDRSFRYDIGKIFTEDCDPNTAQSCGRGIHIAHLDWALRFGQEWDDLAILEVKTDIANIVMPDDTDGKVRTFKIKVIREVPLEECGVYGQILMKRRSHSEAQQHS